MASLLLLVVGAPGGASVGAVAAAGVGVDGVGIVTAVVAGGGDFGDDVGWNKEAGRPVADTVAVAASLRHQCTTVQGATKMKMPEGGRRQSESGRTERL